MSDHANLVFAAIKSREASSSLAASWRRSAVTHGLHPDRITKPERDTDALREALERNSLLVAIAMPCIEELHTALAATDAVIMLSDSTGLVLTQRCGQIRTQPQPENTGVRYAEHVIGTGPVGTVLVEQRSIMLARGQCFSAKVAGITSMGAPVFGPDGQVAGVLTCGYTNRWDERHSSFNKLLFMMVSQFARQIADELFAKSFPQSRIVQIPTDGGSTHALLAVGSDNLILGATRHARRFLGLSDSRLRTPLQFEELLGSPIIHDLAVAEARLIEQAMVRYAYKRTAVAKALGISRSTLYRKLLAIRKVPVSEID